MPVCRIGIEKQISAVLKNHLNLKAEKRSYCESFIVPVKFYANKYSFKIRLSEILGVYSTSVNNRIFCLFLKNLTPGEDRTLFLFQILPFYANGRNLVLCAYRDDFCIPLNRSSWMHD